MKDWSFSDPPNVATITVRQIVVGQAPILLVTHDVDDGGWQFLTGGSFSTADGMIVGLGEIVKLDSSVEELADLPIGWRAWRASPTGEWMREPQEALPG